MCIRDRCQIDQCFNHYSKLGKSEIVLPSNIQSKDIPRAIEQIKITLQRTIDLYKICLPFGDYLDALNDSIIQEVQDQARIGIPPVIAQVGANFRQLLGETKETKKIELIRSITRTLNNILIAQAERFVRVNFLAFWDLTESKECSQRVLKSLGQIRTIPAHLSNTYEQSIINFNFCSKQKSNNLRREQRLPSLRRVYPK
eukprot:TRINITY_DN2065_c0_g1_i5.p1 TRINITY_DN2065_c0_g1~~TRINITY_DN2065_c0_g1_i5.p1  ORF type:complete len:220 (+),score=57.67 TRINITY_DN2065_c0_g1_i5:61-660(+)